MRIAKFEVWGGIPRQAVPSAVPSPDSRPGCWPRMHAILKFAFANTSRDIIESDH